MENSECAGRELSTHDPVYHLRWSRGLDGIDLLKVVTGLTADRIDKIAPIGLSRQQRHLGQSWQHRQ